MKRSKEMRMLVLVDGWNADQPQWIPFDEVERPLDEFGSPLDDTLWPPRKDDLPGGGEDNDTLVGGGGDGPLGGREDSDTLDGGRALPDDFTVGDQQTKLFSWDFEGGINALGNDRLNKLQMRSDSGRADPTDQAGTPGHRWQEHQGASPGGLRRELPRRLQ